MENSNQLNLLGFKGGLGRVVESESGVADEVGRDLVRRGRCQAMGLEPSPLGGCGGQWG